MNLTTTLHEVEPVDGLAALRAWQTDVAIIDDLTTVAGLQEVAVETEYLIEDELCALISKNHPLAKRHYLAISDLSRERWALDTISSTYLEVIVGAIRDQGAEPVINGHRHGFEVVSAMIEANCSVSLVPGLRARDISNKLRLKKIRPKIERKIFVAYRRGEKRNSIQLWKQSSAVRRDY
jgi:DNA-binding transcriptional LysR family regulator